MKWYESHPCLDSGTNFGLMISAASINLSVYVARHLRMSERKARHRSAQDQLCRRVAVKGCTSPVKPAIGHWLNCFKPYINSMTDVLLFNSRTLTALSDVQAYRARSAVLLVTFACDLPCACRAAFANIRVIVHVHSRGRGNLIVQLLARRVSGDWQPLRAIRTCHVSRESEALDTGGYGEQRRQAVKEVLCNTKALK